MSYILDRVPCMPQRQDSFIEQMDDLYHVANKLGLCDAAEGLRAVWGDFKKEPPEAKDESDPVQELRNEALI